MRPPGGLAQSWVMLSLGEGEGEPVGAVVTPPPLPPPRVSLVHVLDFVDCFREHPPPGGPPAGASGLGFGYCPDLQVA